MVRILSFGSLLCLGHQWNSHRTRLAELNGKKHKLYLIGRSWFYVYTVEPLIMDTLKSGQPPYNGQTVHPLPVILGIR